MDNIAGLQGCKITFFSPSQVSTVAYFHMNKAGFPTETSVQSLFQDELLTAAATSRMSANTAAHI